MSNDFPSPTGTHLVCPRCGTPERGKRFCTSCGLNLDLQDELPTADEFAARVRERRWLEAHEAPTKRLSRDKEPRHEVGASRTPRWQTRKITAAMIGITLALLVGAAGLLVVLVVHNSNDSGPDLVDPGTVTDSSPETTGTRHATDKAAGARSPSSTGRMSRRVNRQTSAYTPGPPGVRATIERHWKKREDQVFPAAYEDLSPRLQADPAIGTEAVWAARQKEDLLQSAVVRVRPRDVRKRTAQADVVTLRTQALRSGCKEWSGTYGLVRSGGRWLIDSASISPHAC
jgi:hypothetical protein